MASKSILLAVADPQELIDITQALGGDWETISVPCEADALTQLEKRSFDALLVDFNLGSPDASELLNQALEKRPETVRFLLAYEADLALVAAKVMGTPQILPKPVEPLSLKNRIETGVTDSNSNPSESEPATSPAETANVPAVYLEVLKAFESPEVTVKQVAKIIARDEALTAEVLKLTNSSYLGVPRNLTEPVQAVEALGLETVKVLVMALKFLAEHSRLRTGYLGVDHIWQHSINVAQIARDLVLFETKDRSLAAQALTAGLVHDLGKIVLATNFDDLYGRVHSLARKQPVTLWDVEKEMFGANHGEIGACLVGMWNLPSAIVEATALHHEPPLGEAQQLTVLAAVHIANVLERELGASDDDVMVGPVINTPFLNELGLLERLPVWRAAFANRRSGALEPELESVEDAPKPLLSSTGASCTANHLRGPATSTRTSSSAQLTAEETATRAEAGVRRKTWIYSGVALFLVLFAIWFKTQPEITQTEPAYARTPAVRIAPVSEQSPPVTAALAEQVSPTTVASQPAPVTTAASSETVVPPQAASSAAESATTIAASTTSTNQPPPEPKPIPDFRLNGIIYTSVHPSAIINGQTVRTGDEVNGATVIAISRTTVTLQFNGHRKTYNLR
jgi:HD-like signal output (HDOD) protein